jgi:hypothetical protein
MATADTETYNGKITVMRVLLNQRRGHRWNMYAIITKTVLNFQFMLYFVNILSTTLLSL